MSVSSSLNRSPSSPPVELEGPSDVPVVLASAGFLHDPVERDVLGNDDPSHGVFHHLISLCCSSYLASLAVVR